MEIDSSLRNVVFKLKLGRWIMSNKCHCNDTPSTQKFRFKNTFINLATLVFSHRHFYYVHKYTESSDENYRHAKLRILDIPWNNDPSDTDDTSALSGRVPERIFIRGVPRVSHINRMLLTKRSPVAHDKLLQTNLTRLWLSSGL
jgi:hypothetical protein